MDKRTGLKSIDFARLCNTTKRTLQYYNEIGLFRPALVGDNGYYYYSEDQCDLFMTISALSDLGMALGEIKRYVDDKSPERLKEILLTQREEIRKEQERLFKIQQMIDTKIGMIDKGLELLENESQKLSPRPMEVCMEFCQEEFFVKSDPLNTNDREVLRKELSKLIQLCMNHMLASGAPYSAVLNYKSKIACIDKTGESGTVPAFISEKINNENANITGRASKRKVFETNYAYYAVKTSEKEGTWPILIKPAGKYAVYYLRGDFHYADEAIEILLSYCRERNIATGEYIYKEAVLDEVSEKAPERYITKISVQMIS